MFGEYSDRSGSRSLRPREISRGFARRKRIGIYAADCKHARLSAECNPLFDLEIVARKILPTLPKDCPRGEDRPKLGCAKAQ